VILILTPFIGRFFCGWLCPLGTTLDAAGRVMKTPDNQNADRWRRFRSVKFGLLTGALILALFSINIWGFLDPLSLLNRVFTTVIYPMGTLVVEGMLLGITALPIMEDPAYAVYDWFKIILMPEDQAFLQQSVGIAFFFGIILGMEKVTRRFWCRYICPAGALLGFLSQFRLLERVVGENCSDCSMCNRGCRMDAINEDDARITHKVECIECFACTENCPPKLNAITYRWRRRPQYSSVDYTRRHFLQTAMGSFVALGLMSIGLRNTNKTATMIRPPGSLPEPDFLARCIHCLECVRICQSNGRTLQPDGIRNSLLELWAPVAVMRMGYCEYNCNLCGQVCPTEAILPLSLEQKQKTHMGLAHFDKDLCIPFAKLDDCLVCEELCPTPDKAIKFEQTETILPDGTSKQIKYPYVIEALCIGCGICETKCPITGKAAIFVTIESQQRPVPDDLPAPALAGRLDMGAGAKPTG
jgi:polyferredoxin